MRRLFLFILLALTLSACTLQNTTPTVKIGLVAPFEGRYRDLGYEVIYAVRLAIREANAAGGIDGYHIELVALDDSGDPTQAAEQALKLTTDPQVLIAIGHWLDATTAAAAPVYADHGLPLIVTATEPDDLPPGVVRLYPTAAALNRAIRNLAADAGAEPCAGCDLLTGVDFAADHESIAGGPLWGLRQFPSLVNDHTEVFWVAPVPYPTNPDFIARYNAVATAAEPGAFAALAYDATRLALAAIQTDLDGFAPGINAQPEPTRAGLRTALPRTTLDSTLTASITFDPDNRNWIDPPLTPYTWQDTQRRANP